MNLNISSLGSLFQRADGNSREPFPIYRNTDSSAKTTRSIFQCGPGHSNVSIRSYVAAFPVIWSLSQILMFTFIFQRRRNRQWNLGARTTMLADVKNSPQNLKVCPLSVENT